MAEKEKKHPLNGLGIQSDAEIGGLVPEIYADCRNPITDFSAIQAGEYVCIKGQVHNEPEMKWPSNKKIKTPYFRYTVVADNGTTVEFVVFKDNDKWSEAIVGQGPIHLFGEADSYSGRISIKNPIMINAKDIGRVVPIYPGTRGKLTTKMATAYIRSRYWKNRHSICAYFRDKIGVSPDKEKKLFEYVDTSINSIQQLMDATHCPTTPEWGWHAQCVWETVSAMTIAGWLVREKRERQSEAHSLRISPQTLQEVAKNIPFELVSDQKSAVWESVQELAKPQRTHHLINGDVGSGKTITFLMTAVAAVKEGYRVAIMAPNGPLSAQIFTEAQSFWPEINMQYVSGDSKPKDGITGEMVVGTQALCHRLTPEDGFDLVIVDEQQRYSIDQRESFMSANGNLIESTATCIPRTMALLQFGSITISRIQQQHADKHIQTRIVKEEQKQAVFKKVKQHLANDERVLVVYPLKEGKEEEGVRDKESIIESYELWDNAFPGDVRMLHGDMKPQEKQDNLDDLIHKRARLLIATTVVEVGINIPDLTYVVVVNPDRAGLVTLHQIRGRLVRHGGQGYCDLFCMNKINEKTQRRLQVLCDSNDGFEIAEMDLKLRGAGNLQSKSTSQSGKTNGILLNQSINVDYVRLFFDSFEQKALR